MTFLTLGYLCPTGRSRQREGQGLYTAERYAATFSSALRLSFVSIIVKAFKGSVTTDENKPKSGPLLCSLQRKCVHSPIALSDLVMRRTALGRKTLSDHVPQS